MRIAPLLPWQLGTPRGVSPCVRRPGGLLLVLLATLSLAITGGGCGEELRDTVPREVSLTTAPSLPHPVVMEDGRRGRVVAATICLERLEVEGSAFVIADRGAAWHRRLARAVLPEAHAHPGHDHGAESTVAGGFHRRVLLDLAEPDEVRFETAPVRARQVSLGLCGAPEAALTLSIAWDVDEKGSGEASDSEVSDSGGSDGAVAVHEVSLVVPGPLEVEEIPFEVDWTGSGPFALELLVNLGRLAGPGGAGALVGPATWGARAR